MYESLDCLMKEDTKENPKLNSSSLTVEQKHVLFSLTRYHIPDICIKLFIEKEQLFFAVNCVSDCSNELWVQKTRCSQQRHQPPGFKSRLLIRPVNKAGAAVTTNTQSESILGSLCERLDSHTHGDASV